MLTQPAPDIYCQRRQTFCLRQIYIASADKQLPAPTSNCQRRQAIVCAKYSIAAHGGGLGSAECQQAAPPAPNTFTPFYINYYINLLTVRLCVPK